MPHLLTADESSFPNPKSRAALVAYKAFADVAAKGSLFVVTIVAARRLTPQAFGVFALGSTIGWIAAVAADFGIQMHLARSVARTPERAQASLRRWLRVRCLTAAASLGVVALGLLATGASGDLAVPILLLALMYAVSGVVEFLHYFYRGVSRSDVESSLTIWQRTGTLVCGLAALFWRPTVDMLAFALLLPVLVTCAASLRIALAMEPARNVAPAPAPTMSGRSEFMADVAPIGAGILLSALYFRVDVLLVQWWASTELVGRYNAVFRLVEALRLFPAAVLAVALPALCRARDWRPLRTVAIGLTGFAVVVTAVLAITARDVITFVYGAAYTEAVPAFRALLFSFPLLSLNYALTQQLIGWDRQRAFAVVCGAALAANLALNTWLIPAFSIEGAAWATLGTELVVTAGCAIALAMTRAADESAYPLVLSPSKDERTLNTRIVAAER